MAIPNEGTLLWKIGTLLTGLEFKIKYGLDYQVLMRYEHVNTADEIENVLRVFFKIKNKKIFGVSPNLGLYRFYECELEDKKIAEEFLEFKKVQVD